MAESGKRFTADRQEDPVEFYAWLVNALHLGLTGGRRKRRSVVTDCLQGELRVVTAAGTGRAKDSDKVGRAGGGEVEEGRGTEGREEEGRRAGRRRGRSRGAAEGQPREGARGSIPGRRQQSRDGEKVEKSKASGTRGWTAPCQMRFAAHAPHAASTLPASTTCSAAGPGGVSSLFLPGPRPPAGAALQGRPREDHHPPGALVWLSSRRVLLGVLGEGFLCVVARSARAEGAPYPARRRRCLSMRPHRPTLSPTLSLLTPNPLLALLCPPPSPPTPPCQPPGPHLRHPAKV